MTVSLIFLGILLAAHIFVGDICARVAGMVGLCIWCAFSPTDDRRIKVFMCSLMILVLSILVAPVLALINVANPQLKYDVYLHAIDHILGFCPSGLLVRSIDWNHGLIRLTIGLYQLLPTMMAAAYGWALYYGKNSNALLRAYSLTGFAAILYMIVPAAGPAFLIGPAIHAAHSVPAALILIPLNYPNNSIPSMHLGASLVIWYFTKEFRPARIATLIFVAITAFSTLALGEHYLMDLIMSFPLALFAVNLVTGKFMKAVTAFAVMLLWLILIRFETPMLLAHGILTWMLAALTALLCGRRLATLKSVSVSVVRNNQPLISPSRSHCLEPQTLE